MSVADNKKAVQVLFPCVHGLASGQLVTINCFASAEQKSTIKVVTAGVDEEIAGRVIGASRYGESNNRTGVGVMALFSNPFFSGESYGLALSVADKLARFDCKDKWTEIYATGRIPADGCGRVEAVGGFVEKLDLLAKKAKPGSLFLYPAKNSITTGQIQEKIDLLQGKGIKCIAVVTVGDLQGKIWVTDRGNKGGQVVKKVSTVAANMPANVWQILSGLALAGIACFLIYLVFSSPAGSLPPVLTDLTTQKKKNNINESEKAFSHQEIKQEDKPEDRDSTTVHKASHTNESQEKESNKLEQETLFESLDVEKNLIY